MPTIMVATDFSTRSDRALRRATLIARHSGASLHLVHAVDDDQPQTLVDAARHSAGAVLDGLAATVREVDGLACSSEIVTGDPFVRVADLANAAAVDLLVMGPHRRQFLVDQFRGTTVERTLRRSLVPVLVANALPAGDYGWVVVPVDLQPASATIFSRVLRLPLGPGLRFLALYVYDLVAQQMMGRAMVTGDQRAAYEAEERRAAGGLLAAFSAEHGLPDSVLQEVRPITRTVAATIFTTALEAGANLIALNSSHKGWLERSVLGSVTEGLLRDTDIDVLVMPPFEA